VAKDSPAEAMGVRGGNRVVVIDGQDFVLGGDIVLAVAGVAAKPANLGKVREELSRLRPGDPMKLTVLRAGRIIELTGTAP
jgi:serine protease Do